MVQMCWSSGRLSSPGHMTLYTAAVFLATLGCVTANLEHQCSGPYSSNVSRCGMYIFRFIIRKCSPSNVSLNQRQPTDVSAARVFLSEEQANQLLNTELRNGKLAGPTCECCMHRCTSNEFEQYCSPMSTPRRRRQTRRTRRTRRSAIKEKHFTESAISDMYEAINRDLVQEISEPDSELLSLHQVEQLTVLNGWKIKNTINSEIRELFQLRRSVPIPAEQSHLSPPDSEPMNSNREWLDKTDTNAQNAEHPTKPKLLARNALMRENQHTRSSTGHRRHRHGHHQPPKHQQPPESDIP